jgi:uncharacterized glyoxalase superfamily metalloenzyme YdcJ
MSDKSSLFTHLSQSDFNKSVDAKLKDFEEFRKYSEAESARLEGLLAELEESGSEDQAAKLLEEVAAFDALVDKKAKQFEKLKIEVEYKQKTATLVKELM